MPKKTKNPNRKEAGKNPKKKKKKSTQIKKQASAKQKKNQKKSERTKLKKAQKKAKDKRTKLKANKDIFNPKCEWYSNTGKHAFEPNRQHWTQPARWYLTKDFKAIDKTAGSDYDKNLRKNRYEENSEEKIARKRKR